MRNEPKNQCLSLSLIHPGGTENAEAEDERQRHAQASWVQRMLTSIMGDTTLFTTREGRAGKVHNFMLGLNLNSTLPFSPFSSMNQTSVDEEVDAVTGTNESFSWHSYANLDTFWYQGPPNMINPFQGHNSENSRITLQRIQTYFFVQNCTLYFS